MAGKMRRAPSPLVQGLVHIGLFVFTCAALYPVLWVVKMALSSGLSLIHI